MTIEPTSVGIGRTLLGAAGRLTVGNIISRSLSFVTGIVIARTLSDVEFGGFGAIQGVVFVSATLATFALGMAATRFIANARSEDPERAADLARLVLAVSALSVAVVGVAFYVLAPWLATSIMSEPSLGTALRVGVIYLVCLVGFGVASGVLLGYERYTASAVAAVTQNVVILVAFLWLGPRMRLTGTVLATALGFAVSWGLAVWFLRKELLGFSPARFRATVRSELPAIVRFCLPHFLSTLALGPATAMAAILLARSEPGGYSELGYFTAGQRYYLLILFFSGFLAPALLPVFSRVSADAETSRRGLDFGLIGTGMLAVPLGVGVILGARSLMHIFGTVYARHWTVLIPVAAWATLEAVGGVLSTSLMARGRQWFVFVQQVGFALGLVGLSILFRPYGATGLAGAYLVSIVGVAAASFMRVRALLEPSPRAVRAYLLAFLLTFSAAGVALVLPRGWDLPAGVVGAGLAYSSYLALLRPAERSALFTTIRNAVPGRR